ISQLGERVKELEAEAEQASAELQLQRQRNQIDALTELANRSAYEHRLDVELERFDRYQQDFCLIVADIDHFKVINDSYGHLAGDKVLRLVAQTLHKRLRRVDFIARYGGEEFAIILPATHIDNALSLMQAMGQQIRQCPFHFNNQPLQISLSFGLAAALAGDTAESLFARADRALYSAKQQGRDRCVVAND
ncbi:MAG: GGDEF domain-containing protein, partial [Pseudomonadales bacterium]|nr:GGDEF domain-containing protein [Pseudomonadales bacterium]